jgi:tRNA U34 5-methylaminomethyl-2-thiouridine-forming methyltransferase MnmC
MVWGEIQMSLIKVNQAVLDQQAKDARIAELKQFLAYTDYVALSDYDQDKPDVKKQRQLWRDEIRELEE